MRHGGSLLSTRSTECGGVPHTAPIIAPFHQLRHNATSASFSTAKTGAARSTPHAHLHPPIVWCFAALLWVGSVDSDTGTRTACPS